MKLTKNYVAKQIRSMEMELSRRGKRLEDFVKTIPITRVSWSKWRNVSASAAHVIPRKKNWDLVVSAFERFKNE